MPTCRRRFPMSVIVSLLAAAVVAAVGVRSFWTWDSWAFGGGRKIEIALYRGMVAGTYISVGSEANFANGHLSGGENSFNSSPAVFLLAAVRQDTVHGVLMSIWLPFLLLLVVPVRWLIMLPAHEPAFPVVTTPSQSAAQLHNKS